MMHDQRVSIREMWAEQSPVHDICTGESATGRGRCEAWCTAVKEREED